MKDGWVDGQERGLIMPLGASKVGQTWPQIPGLLASLFPVSPETEGRLVSFPQGLGTYMGAE